MSKGNPKITVRATPALIAEIEKECALSRRGGSAVPKTVTMFVLSAINEKLAHLNRSRKARAPKPAAPDDTSAAL